jgi:hypothetical protein
MYVDRSAAEVDLSLLSVQGLDASKPPSSNGLAHAHQSSEYEFLDAFPDRISQLAQRVKVRGNLHSKMLFSQPIQKPLPHALQKDISEFLQAWLNNSNTQEQQSYFKTMMKQLQQDDHQSLVCCSLPPYTISITNNVW